ncbi:MAG: sugar phosphate isomerase/epimerase [Balneolales bacterium]
MKKTTPFTFYTIASAMIFSLSMISCSTQNTDVYVNQMNIPDEYKIGGVAVGLQAYTFNRFSVMEAIEKTAKAGGKLIELYPGQRLNADDDELIFNHLSSDEDIEKVKAKLDEHGIMAINYGVVSLSDEEDSRKVFEFANTMGIQAVTSEPSMEDMDRLEELVKEYDVMLAIHNHPARPDDPDYRVWDPEYVLSMVEGRDPRLGACADIGHWARSEIVPIEGLKILEGRIISMHMADVDQLNRDGEDVVNGYGIGNIGGVLDELRRQNFGGHISLEYEANWDDNVTDVAQNIGFIHGWIQNRDHDN